MKAGVVCSASAAPEQGGQGGERSVRGGEGGGDKGTGVGMQQEATGAGVRG